MPSIRHLEVTPEPIQLWIETILPIKPSIWMHLVLHVLVILAIVLLSLLRDLVSLLLGQALPAILIRLVAALVLAMD